jgi:membrane protein
MEPFDSLKLLGERMRDRARIGAFLHFVWKRFLGDRLFEAAGALSYTSVFALVPLSMVVFGVLSAFPVFDQWSVSLRSYIFSNFVPHAANAVEKYLSDFSANTKSLTTTGAFALVVSLLVTLTSVEAIFNRIWRVPTARPKFSRFLVYWTVLTLGALVAATSLALSTRFFALAIFETLPGRWLESLMLKLAPMAIEMFAFAAIFKVVPHRTVKWRHALSGAALSVMLFEGVKFGLAAYLSSFDSYQKIYGAIALLPILMLWIYLGWTSILFGASLAASMSAFRYQPVELRLPDGFEIYGLLRMLGRFQLARAKGRGLHSDEILKLEPILTDNLVQEQLGQLCNIGVVSRAESGEWMLSRDLNDVSLGELYEAGRLRVPVAEARLPHRDDALGVAVMHALDGLRMPLRELLKQRVANIYRDIPPDIPGE